MLHGHVGACGQNCQAQAVGHLASYSCHPACLHPLPGHKLIHASLYLRTPARWRQTSPQLWGPLATAPRNHVHSSRALLLLLLLPLLLLLLRLLLHYMGKHLHSCLPLLCSYCLLPTHTPAPAHPLPWVALLFHLVNLPCDVLVNQRESLLDAGSPPHTRWLVARHVSTYTATPHPLRLYPCSPHPYAPISWYLCPVLPQVKAMLCCVVSQCCLRAGQHSGGTEQTGGGVIITVTLIISTCVQKWMWVGCSAAGTSGAPRPLGGGACAEK